MSRKKAFGGGEEDASADREHELDGRDDRHRQMTHALSRSR